MDFLRIEGGHPLQGEVTVSGAKNAALPLIAATLLTDDPVTLSNVPALADVRTMNKLMGVLGTAVTDHGNGHHTYDNRRITSFRAPYELVSTMRASVLVLGPLLARFGEADVSLPGGCAIGVRPVDVLLDGLAALGADITLDGGYIKARVAGRLKGAEMTLSKPAVTGTENLMMAAALADGRTVLHNVAREPEVLETQTLLNAMGAKVKGAGTPTIEIDGVDRLRGVTYTVMPDRIEAGTYIIAAAMNGRGVRVLNARAADNQALFDRLRDAGVDLTVEENAVTVGPTRPYTAVDVITQPFPGFPTDLQAQMMVFLTQAEGASLLTETIYENRFMHVPELCRMGADLTIDGHTVRARGKVALQGAQVMATDLRASASLVLAALAAEGETVLRRVYHLDRGYEHLEQKFNALGARIRREKE